MRTAEGELRSSLRWSGRLLTAGLLLQAGTLLWSHPTAFLVFIGLGGLLVGAGVVLYLLAISGRG